MTDFRLRTIAMVLLIVGRIVAQQGSASKPQPKIPSQNETVVVTGTSVPAPESEIDRSVTVIRANESSDLYKSWVDLLDFAPSVDLQRCMAPMRWRDL